MNFSFLSKVLNGLGASLRIGDVTSLHKGSITVNGATSRRLKAELQAAQKSGEFPIKLKLLPDVDSFKILLGDFNPLLGAFGLQTRFGSNKTIEKGNNSRNNRYLLYMYNRLLRNQKDGVIYWAIALQLLRSSVYLIATLHHLDRNFYRQLSQARLLALITQVKRLLGTERPSSLKNTTSNITFPPAPGRSHLPLRRSITYHRTYLPKGPNKFRPLGVPTIAWRVYLAMWLVPLNGYYVPHTNMHGFVPGRGTLTA